MCARVCTVYASVCVWSYCVLVYYRCMGVITSCAHVLWTCVCDVSVRVFYKCVSVCVSVCEWCFCVPVERGSALCGVCPSLAWPPLIKCSLPASLYAPANSSRTGVPHLPWDSFQAHSSSLAGLRLNSRVKLPPLSLSPPHLLQIGRAHV